MCKDTCGGQRQNLTHASLKAPDQKKRSTRLLKVCFLFFCKHLSEGGCRNPHPPFEGRGSGTMGRERGGGRGRRRGERGGGGWGFQNPQPPLRVNQRRALKQLPKSEKAFPERHKTSNVKKKSGAQARTATPKWNTFFQSERFFPCGRKMSPEGTNFQSGKSVLFYFGSIPNIKNSGRLFSLELSTLTKYIPKWKNLEGEGEGGGAESR